VKTPLLTIYTPTYKRPGMLARCRASVCAQTVYLTPPIQYNGGKLLPPLPQGEGGMAIQHLIVVDEVGVGIAGMFREIGRHLDEMKGGYVYVLQDDDVLADERVVADLERFAKLAESPPVIMVRNMKRGMCLPLVWKTRPCLGWVDLGSYVVRRDVFVENVNKFGQRYQGDFDFIDALWEAGYEFVWFDRLFARAQATGMGRTEAQLREDGELKL